jgi:hypothetical protein
MKTLYGACGIEGCLECIPLFVEVLDDDEMDDGTYEVEVLITSANGG